MEKGGGKTAVQSNISQLFRTYGIQGTGVSILCDIILWCQGQNCH